MAYTITIKYVKPEKPEEYKPFWEIPRMFVPESSYVDSPAYEGTVYDTNVDGWGFIEPKPPYDSTAFPYPVPLAQFRIAAISETGEVTFTTDDYKVAWYYVEAGKQMLDEGFTVTMTEDSATEPTEPEEPTA